MTSDEWQVKDEIPYGISQFVEKPPVKKSEGFCLLVVDKIWNT